MGWNFLNNFHPLIIYIYAGSLISLIAVTLLISLGKIKSAKLRSSFLILPLFLPVVAYFLFHVFFNKPCTVGILQNHSNMTWLGNICIVGGWFANNLTPLFILALTASLVKGCFNLLAARSLKIKYGVIKQGTHPRTDRILNELSKKINITCPELIVTNQSHFRAFTFGTLKPIIVISKGLLEGLNDEELEAVFAHELAHIKRKDFLVNWIAVIIRDFSLFNPIAIYCFYKFFSEQEQACDEIGLGITKKPIVYGQTLIKVWKNSRPSSFRAMLVENLGSPEFLRPTSLLEIRIKKVIDFKLQKNIRKSIMWPAIISVIFFTLVFLALFC